MVVAWLIFLANGFSDEDFVCRGRLISIDGERVDLSQVLGYGTILSLGYIRASENDFQLLAWIECIAYGDLHFFGREAGTPQSSTPENTCASLAS